LLPGRASEVVERKKQLPRLTAGKPGGVMKRKVKSSITIAFLGFWLSLTGSAGAATRIEVEIEDFAYVPAQIAVQVGDTVGWKNADNVAHSSTSGQPGVPDGMWDSGLLSAGQEFSYVFNQEGSFPYYCTPHNWMTGLVTVEPVSDTSDTGTTPVVEEPLFTRNGTQLEIKASIIQFMLAGPGSVKLTIHDVLGREQAVVADAAYSSGVHSFQRPSLPSGIYFVRLVSGDGMVIIKRMLQLA
jgi:plastocyanin